VLAVHPSTRPSHHCAVTRASHQPRPQSDTYHDLDLVVTWLALSTLSFLPQPCLAAVVSLNASLTYSHPRSLTLSYNNAQTRSSVYTRGVELHH